MLKELKFVQGSVATKELIPDLTHFRIKQGRVSGYNGTLALSTPLAFDIDCVPKAVPLVKAIQNCTDTVQLSMTKAGRLSVKSGKFKAFVECLPNEETAHVEPEGERFEINGEKLIAACKQVFPFISQDASRPWTTGALLHGNSVFATNNVTLVECWVEYPFPITCNLPRLAVRELIRIGEAPVAAQSTHNSITFHYQDERWLRCVLLDTQWPDVLAILNTPSNPWEITPEFFEAVESMRPFVGERGAVYLEADRIYTSRTEGDGASYDIQLPATESVYNVEMLRLLNGVANSIDFTSYPKPCMFFGDNLRGAIIGMKQYEG